MYNCTCTADAISSSNFSRGDVTLLDPYSNARDDDIRNPDLKRLYGQLIPHSKIQTGTVEKSEKMIEKNRASPRSCSPFSDSTC